MNLRDALEKMDRRNCAGEIVDRKTGEEKTISRNQRDVIRAHVRGAMVQAAGVERKAIGDVDIMPFAGVLPDCAYSYAEERGYARPENYRSSVVTFLDIVLERRYLGPHRSGKVCQSAEERVHPAWRALFDALREEIGRQEEELAAEGKVLRGGIRGYPSQLVAFQELSALNGVRRPHDLPERYSEVREWATDAGLSDGQWAQRINGYRKARELLGADELPELYQEVRSNDRGVRGVRHLRRELEERGCATDPRSMATLDILRVLSPQMAAAVDRSLEDGRERNLSDVWMREQVDGTSRIVASMIRLGIDPTERTFLSLWEETLEVESSADVVDELIAAELGEDYDRTAVVSLMRRVIDEAAPAGWSNSPLEVVRRGPQTGDGLAVPYVGTLDRDVRYAWGTTRRVYEEALSTRDRERWLAAEREYQRVLDHMRDHNTRFDTSRHVRKELVIGWGRAVCVGLPALRRQAADAFESLDRFIERHGDIATRRRRALAKEADSIATDYVLAALLLDDGLRVKNYSGAIAGEHIDPEIIRDSRDRPAGFHRILTRLRGMDHPDVRLKMRTDTNGGERVRERELTPAIVDHRLLYRYWYETRPRNLVRCGELEDAAEYDPEDDDYAVFVTSRAPQDGRTYRAHHQNERKLSICGVTPDALSRRLGRTLYWMVTEALGEDLPPMHSEPFKKEYRGLFAAHVIRTMIATYFGGIRGEWTIAGDLTDDTEDTLRSHYAKVRTGVTRLLNREGPENPRHFDTLIDRMLRCREADDWARFWDRFNPDAYDPENPEDSFNLLKRG